MSRFINPVPQYLNSAGDPIVAGQMFFYEVGSTTPKDVYLDADLTIPAANPVLLDADGRMPDTFLSGVYRTILSEPSSGEQWERDNVGSEFNEGYGSAWSSTTVYNIPDVVLFNGAYYQSLINNNINNSPAPGSSTGAWSINSVVVLSGSNSNGTYRVWADGTIEQWGIIPTLVATTTSGTFPIPFTSTVHVTGVGWSNGPSLVSIKVRSDTTNLTTLSVFSDGNHNFSYYAKGS